LARSGLTTLEGRERASNAPGTGERVPAGQARRQATRERVLAAARDLFDEVGYTETTIRMVAQRASVSVGSVFTSFASKAHLLHHVMENRLEALYGELEQVIPHLRGPTVDRLRSIMAVHYGFETRRLRLFLAHVGAAYLWEPGDPAMLLGRNPRLRAMVLEVLAGGIARGEVREDAHFDVFIDCMLATYLWNYRLARQENVDTAALIATMDRQIGVLFEGIAAKTAISAGT
jgi:AcrR family transcriptional regulator